jgi:hypothetical protein
MIKAIDAEIACLQNIIRQIDLLHSEFINIQGIRETVTIFWARVEPLDIRV